MPHTPVVAPSPSRPQTPLTSAPLVCLASASPRRRELLQQIGIAHSVDCADVDESVRDGESAREYAVRVAHAKAATVAARRAGTVVLAADTVVVLQGRICGKPRDEPQGLQMLRRLSGRVHQVLTAVVLCVPQRAPVSALSVTEVSFRALSEVECRAYVHSGEGHDKAGGYAIQGLAAIFIERISGSYSGVMGLPLFETAALLGGAGIGCAGIPAATAPAS